MKSTRFAVAIAVVCVACVKVSDDVKATFAPGQPSEVDNFSPRSPHSIAPPDTQLTQATIPIVDASVPTTAPEGICPRDANASSSVDAGASLTSLSSSAQVSKNCLQDAGNP